MIGLSSSDGVSLAVHDYNPDSRASTVLFSHATGFHGRVFDPVASALTSTHHCITFDYRGYGDSTCPPDWQVEWVGYGDDALAAARHAARHAAHQGPIIGAGHSMGGAALVMAALREPQLFRALVLFEPIIFPLATPEQQRGGPSPLIDGARRRRAVFASFDDALTNYSSKPPLNIFDAQTSRADLGDLGCRLADEPRHHRTKHRHPDTLCHFRAPRATDPLWSDARPADVRRVRAHSRRRNALTATITRTAHRCTAHLLSRRRS